MGERREGKIGRKGRIGKRRWKCMIGERKKVGEEENEEWIRKGKCGIGDRGK